MTSFDRDAGLERLAADRFDVLVVGGGITGAGVALDAASRGLRTALVEREDFGSGTSSRSSKLVHGGLRYLSQGDYRLVAQALAERQRLLENAPHLVRPLPFVIPAYRSRAKMRAISTALWTYDLIGGFRIGSRHRRLSVAETLARTPALRPDGLVGGHLYLDAQADDARLTLAVVRTAVLDHRAVAVNHVAVREVRAGAGAVVDAGGGREIEVRAPVVVNATGVWADSLAGAAGGGSPSIRPAKGVHITVPAALVPTSVALVLPVPGDGRSIFVVPWPGADRVYIGTTDTDYDGPLDAPLCTAEDTAYLLDAMNAALTTTVDAGDVVGSWAGLRPLVAGVGTSRSADLSRRHRVTRSAEGVVTIAGGKLTTYRAMAADTVDEVQAALGRPRTPSPTAGLALRGAGAGAGSDHLTSRHGSEARLVLAILAGDESLAQPLVPGLPYLRGEATYAARYEMAFTLDDVLSRRTRATILDRAASLEAAAGVAAVVAPELGWDAAETAAQINAYRAGGG